MTSYPQKNLPNRLNHLQSSTLTCLNEIPPHFIHEIKTKGYDVIGAVIEIPAQKRPKTSLYYYLYFKTIILKSSRIGSIVIETSGTKLLGIHQLKVTENQMILTR